MKDVTLKEFIEIAKDNNQLKDKVLETVNGGVPKTLGRTMNGGGR